MRFIINSARSIISYTAVSTKVVQKSVKACATMSGKYPINFIKSSESILPASSSLRCTGEALSVVYTHDASINISTSINTRNIRVNRCDASISALCFYLCLRRPGLHVRRNDVSISTSNLREEIVFFAEVIQCFDQFHISFTSPTNAPSWFSYLKIQL